MILKANSGFGNPLENFPHYQIEVHYHHEQKLLEGKMQVRYSPEFYPSGELLLSLPMNRFRTKDPRGLRRHQLVPIFSLERYENDLEDPLFPEGFSEGGINVLSVKDASGKNLDYHLESNPDLEKGYSQLHGLLRVTLPDPLEEPELIIEFKTFLPVHTLEGGLNGSMITSNWHPSLLNWDGRQWIKDGNTPNPGTWQVTWSSSKAGTLITSLSAHQEHPAGEKLILPQTHFPLKSFPLIFSDRYQLLSHEDDQTEPQGEALEDRNDPKDSYHLESFHFRDYPDRADLIHQWVSRFISFTKEQYGLKHPWENIRVVAVEAEYEHVKVINNLILIPLPNYKRSGFLDRRVLGLVSLSLGQLWFGEKIWNDEDLGLWISKGIPAFLGLRFFEQHYGKDAGIFGFIDWMNPRFREHFIEDMALSNNEETAHPIYASFQASEDPRLHMIRVTYKTAMVLSMLEYMLGKQGFQKGFQSFTENHFHKIGSLRNFQSEFEEVFKENNGCISNTSISEKGSEPKKNPLHSQGCFPIPELDWFFDQWFLQDVELDYALGNLKTQKKEGGDYLTEVEVKKTDQARMPLEVMLTTEDGKKVHQLILGDQKSETLFFTTKSPAKKVSLDPDEQLLESKRTNNHSFSFHRVRFAFDWKRKRERLWLLVPGISSNAIDGNSYGLAVRHNFEEYRILVIPGYGSKNKRFLFQLDLDRNFSSFKGLSGGLTFKEHGGIRSDGLRLNYNSSKRYNQASYSFSASIFSERLFSASTEQLDEEVEQSGKNNIFTLAHQALVPFDEKYLLQWSLNNEQPSQELETDFHYSKSSGSISQTLHVGHRKWFVLSMAYGTIGGTPPLQKKFQLGSPSTLRGFPQTIKLMYDHLALASLDFKFPLFHAPFWGDVSATNIQGVLFYDQGKGWSAPLTQDKAPSREDAGFGIEWVVDTVSLFQVPIKFEVAYPLNDPDYEKPQIILLGTLSW
ncbi:MAG: M1 family aminopeptidase [bacterium]